MAKPAQDRRFRCIKLDDFVLPEDCPHCANVYQCDKEGRHRNHNGRPNVRIRPDLYEALKKASEDFQRPIAWQLNAILRQWLIAKGYMGK